NDLASAFIKQYNYNSYLAPDRDELRALTQKERKSFKEYAQRWRELAAHDPSSGRGKRIVQDVSAYP
ncbi:hypothetical protein A2U01_0112851, partial [Trifolium medium]|nr:hypothetical protein [Trifolium medium]